MIDLRTYFDTEDGALPAVDGVTFSIRRGQTLALVGESGCGKSVTSLSLLRLIQKPGRIAGGKILLRSARAGEIDIARLKENSRQLFHVRGGLVSMIFQEPMSALSPVHTIGDQITEAIFLHQDVSAAEARRPRNDPGRDRWRRCDRASWLRGNSALHRLAVLRARAWPHGLLPG